MRRHTAWRWMLVLCAVALVCMMATSVLGVSFPDRKLLIDPTGLPPVSVHRVPQYLSPGGPSFPETAIFLVQTKDGWIALSNRCTHLHEEVFWLPDQRRLVDPRSGSYFTMTGLNVAGPAPRPLDRFPVTQVKGGWLEVDLSRRQIQKEGRWDAGAESL